MLKEYFDRDSPNVTPVNAVSAVPQNQSEMNCEEVDCEEINFNKTDPTCSKLQNSDILKDLNTLWKLGTLKKMKIADSGLLSLFLCSNVMVQRCPGPSTGFIF